MRHVGSASKGEFGLPAIEKDDVGEESVGGEAVRNCIEKCGLVGT